MSVSTKIKLPVLFKIYKGCSFIKQLPVVAEEVVTKMMKSNLHQLNADELTLHLEVTWHRCLHLHHQLL